MADFSFDLATDSCPFNDITSCSSVLMRSRLSPKQRTSDEIREVKAQDFSAAEVAALSIDPWTEST